MARHLAVAGLRFLNDHSSVLRPTSRKLPLGLPLAPDQYICGPSARHFLRRVRASGVKRCFQVLEREDRHADLSHLLYEFV